MALGTSHAKGVWTDPGGPPRSFAVTLWVGGGEITFKGPGRWPHVQEPGPGSRRRQSHSGSAPPGLVGGWGAPQHWDTISWVPSAMECCHHLQGDSSPPATCVPLDRTQTSQPSPTMGRGTEGGFPQSKAGVSVMPPGMSPSGSRGQLAEPLAAPMVPVRAVHPQECKCPPH